jgi:hypothetical protein
MMCNALEGTLCWIRARPQLCLGGGVDLSFLFIFQEMANSVFLFFCGEILPVATPAPH